MALNFTAADRVGGIGGYIGGITSLLGMLGNGNPLAVNGKCEGDHTVTRYDAGEGRHHPCGSPVFRWRRGTGRLPE